MFAVIHAFSSIPTEPFGQPWYFFESQVSPNFTEYPDPFRQVTQLAGYFEPLIKASVGVASKLKDHQQQMTFLDQTKTMAESALQMLYAAKEGGGNPKVEELLCCPAPCWRWSAHFKRAVVTCRRHIPTMQ